MDEKQILNDIEMNSEPGKLKVLRKMIKENDKYAQLQNNLWPLIKWHQTMIRECSDKIFCKEAYTTSIQDFLKERPHLQVDFE